MTPNSIIQQTNEELKDMIKDYKHTKERLDYYRNKILLMLSNMKKKKRINKKLYDEYTRKFNYWLKRNNKIKYKLMNYRDHLMGINILNNILP